MWIHSETRDMTKTYRQDTKLLAYLVTFMFSSHF